MNRNGYRWWILVAATVTQMAAALSTQGIGVFAGFLQHDFTLSNSEVGILASTLNIAPIFGFFFIGRVLDYVGERIPIFLGMMIIGISMLCMSFANHYWMLLIVLFFCGVGYSPIQPGGSKAIYTWFTPRQRGFAMGIRQAALPLGGALSAVMFPYIIHYSSWRGAAIFTSITIVAGGILFFLVYRNSPQIIHTQRNLSYKFISTLFKQGNLLRISRIGVTLITIQTSILIFWMLFIHHQFHIALIKCAWYLFAIQIFGAIGRIVLSVLGSIIKNGYRHIIIITIIMLIIILITIAYLPGNTETWIIMLISCILGFFSFGWYGPWVIWMSEESPVESIGTTLSISMALNQVAIVLTPVLFGILLDITGAYTVPWLCLAVGAGIILLKDLCANQDISVKYRIR